MKRLILVAAVLVAGLLGSSRSADAHPWRRPCAPVARYSYYAPAHVHYAPRVRYVHRAPVRVTYGYAAPAYAWGYAYPVGVGYYYGW
jgi:hypothetical protein